MAKIQTKLPVQGDTYEDYLARGGHAAGPRPEMLPEPRLEPSDVKFTLTIPGRLAAYLDRLRTERPTRTTRHRWVIEAIEQRVAREDQGGG